MTPSAPEPSSAPHPSSAPEPNVTPPGRLHHYGGFVLGGSCAFVTDVGLLALLTHGLGLSPFLARLLSISVAMVVSWWINRTITFPRTVRPSLAEYGRFASVAWTANAFNYVVFSSILLLRPGTPETLAAALASLAAMVFSYLGMRHAVFR